MLPGNAAGIAAQRQPLTAALCLNIVRQNTPNPENYDQAAGLAQLLAELGVNGASQTAFHRAGIRADLRHLQYEIALTDINSGPMVTMGDCLQSVHDNAV